MSVLKSGIFTKQLSTDTLIITESMGVRQISVFNGTSTTGTALGTQKLSGVTPDPVNIEEGDTFTVNAIEGSVLDSLTIDAPAGCTLKIIGIV